MNEAASQFIVDCFLKGGFDVYEAMLGLAIATEASESAEADEASVADALGSNTVCLQATIQDGGAVAMLLTVEDASKILSLFESGEVATADSLDDAAIATLTEIVDSVHGGGVANMCERFGQPKSVEIASHEVVVRDAASAAELLTFLGDGPVLTPFSITSDPNFQSVGYFLNNAAFEARIPDEQLNDNEALVSEDEMKDILSDFTPEQESSSYSGRDSMPENLDVILGIDLTATARLGKIEMPISQVLDIGPGSIIEVGQLVDDPVELLINGRLIARGDVVVVDEKFGLRITEIISPKERIESLG
jgi:flagellar motor switch protein FliN